MHHIFIEQNDLFTHLKHTNIHTYKRKNKQPNNQTNKQMIAHKKNQKKQIMCWK